MDTELKRPAVRTVEGDVWPSLRGYWHPVAIAPAAGSSPLAVELLGERLVLCRLGEQLACFKDLCVHRGAALSCGSVDGETLICAYHGWSYAADGRCIRIPQRPGHPIPTRARLIRYSVAERYGLAWVCLADSPSAPIPELPEWDDEAFDHVLIGPYRWKASAARAAENFIDMAHFAWVHPGILGDPEHPEIPEFAIERHGDELRYECVDGPSGIHPMSQQRKYRVFRPFTVYRRLVRRPMTSEGSDSAVQQEEIIFYTITPNSRYECTQYQYILRNYADGEGDLNDRRELSEMIAEQDRRIVENQHPEELPVDLSEELHVRGIDAVSVEYRRFLGELGRLSDRSGQTSGYSRQGLRL